MLSGNNNETKIWNFLRGQGLSNAGIAGLMGNLYAESGLRPNNLQNSYEGKLGMTDTEYTELVDKGVYPNFSRDGAGYGLCQWTFYSRKQNLLDYTRSIGKSIGDLEAQLSFLLQELSSGYKTLLNVLKTTTSVRTASDAVLTQFEQPADQSEAVKVKRAEYSQAYYEKYAKEDAMTEQEKRRKIVSIAQSYIGRKEKDGSHKEIIDLYNAHKPLARGYTVKYIDPWCATFASTVAIKAGLTDIIPTECGCSAMVELFKKLGSWEENDAYVPQPADYIFYDWQDGTNYATTDNTGAPDHVGIVEKVVGTTITVIEGNISDAVGRRTLQVNGRYIRGYGLPKYGSGASGTAQITTPKPTVSAPAISAEEAYRKATGAAKSFDKALAGTYTVNATSGLHIRDGAGSNKASLAVLPNGTKVQHYGYYTEVNGVKWLYIQVTYNGVTYTGFSSAKYLSK